ncbi:MAG: FKBP-type peptidyl-prolyl cis-trans isomerase [Leadbetterella sp.]|nr:FKBP-type peptidyl-prolyl cis-trans isomerase [Leadbetterella sp.]
MDSDITTLGKEQEKIMEEYVTTKGLTAKKEALYDYRGNYYPVYTLIETKGDSITKYTKNEAIWVAYTIRTLEDRVVETKTVTDSVLVYEGGYSGKIMGLSVAATNFMGVGGKGRFLVPSTLGYGSEPPGGVEYNAVLIVDVQVLGRLTESEQIQYYIKRNNFKVTKTSDTGLLYSQLTTTTDSLAVGPSVKVKYTGRFANGHVFDKSTDGITFQLNGVVPGFAEAIKLMRKGEKATAILPSKIAYGEDGGGQMPVYMPLIFDIEVVEPY